MYMGYGARDIVVAGDSAGGNLALELCLKLKEQGRAQPRALLLFSPWMKHDRQRQKLQKAAKRWARC